jgi:hypothetical protein
MRFLFRRAVGLALAAFVPLSAAQAREEQLLYSFAGGSDGQQPWAGVVRDGRAISMSRPLPAPTRIAVLRLRHDLQADTRWYVQRYP